MKLPGMFATAAVIVSLSTPAALCSMDVSASKGLPAVTVTESKQDEKKDLKQLREKFEKNPVGALEKMKERVQSLVREGKLTKEKADEITARIDSKIKEIQAFEKLPLKVKKETLLKDCRTALDQKVQVGKMEKSKADAIFLKYSKKLESWDGTGYPKFHFRRFGDKHCTPDT